MNVSVCRSSVPTAVISCPVNPLIGRIFWNLETAICGFYLAQRHLVTDIYLAVT